MAIGRKKDHGRETILFYDPVVLPEVNIHECKAAKLCGNFVTVSL